MLSKEFASKVFRRRIIGAWGDMSESDKMHFINQVALALTVWGSDPSGKELVLKVIDILLKDGSSTLTDFGLYINRVAEHPLAKDRQRKIRKAALVLEGYRMKNSLPSEPSIPLEI